LIVRACCGGKSGPVEPAQVSAEQEQELKEQQEKVNAAEREQLTMKAVTPARKVNREEWQHQRRKNR
jgi:hypothetical protein